MVAKDTIYSGEHKQHGMDVQVVAAPDGEPLWTSWSLLGSVHNTRAARVWRIAERIKASGLLGLGDKGYVGLSEVVFCPFKGRGKPQWKKDANSAHAKLRSPGERAIAQLDRGDLAWWRTLPRFLLAPTRTTLPFHRGHFDPGQRLMAWGLVLTLTTVVVTGLLLWDLRRDYKARLWAEHKALSDLDRQLREAQRRHHQVGSSRDDWPEKFGALTARIGALRPRVLGLQESAQLALLRQQEFLQGIAVDELKAQRERLNTYMVQARFALASIYDRAAARVEPAAGTPAALAENGQ